MRSFVRTLVFSALASLSAVHAHALSCIRPDVAQAFQHASDAEEDYMVLLGSIFVPMVPPRSQTGDQFNPEPVTVQAFFSGQALGVDGFQPIEDLVINVTMGCAGPWCGVLRQGPSDILAFVEMTETGPSLMVDPCYTEVFQPNASDIARVQACMRGEGCEPL
ncbi:MAG: hypothetical protein AAGL89_01090 [Pseudomonadota bacterium]